MLKSWKNWPGETLPYDLVVLHPGHVLFITDKGLYLGSIFDGTIDRLEEREANQPFLSGVKLDNDQVLLSAQSGLYVLTLNSKTPSRAALHNYQLNEDLPVIQRMYRNKAGFVFLSSYNKGLYVIKPDNIIFKTQHLFRNPLEAGFASQEEMGVLDEMNKWTFFSIKGNLWYQKSSLQKGDKQIISANIFGKSAKVLTTDFELPNVNPYKRLLDSYTGNGGKANLLLKFYLGREGIYYLTNGLGEIYKWAGTEWANEKVSNPEKLPFIFFESMDERYYLAAVNQQQVCLYPKNSDHAPIQSFDFNGEIHSFFKDWGSDKYWMASSQGLISLDKDDSIPKRRLNAHPQLDMNCFCSFQDTRGRIWSSVKDHIYCFDPEKDRIDFFSAQHGALKGNYLKGGCGLLENGTGYFVSSTGILSFAPNEAEIQNNNSGVRISRFAINHNWAHFQDTLKWLDTLTLDYDQNTLTFDFSLIDYSGDPSAGIVYQMSKYDESPIETDHFTQFISYNSMPPGFYRLKVAGSMVEFLEGKNVKSVWILIKTPFWKEPWFVVLGFFSSLLAIMRTIDFFHKRELEKKDILLKEQRLKIEKKEWIEKERSRIASDMHDDLGSGLTTIRYLAEKAMESKISEREREQIKKIAEYSTLLVDNMSELIWAMNSRYDTLANMLAYIRRYAYEYLDQFEIKLRWNSPEIPDEVEISGGRRRNVFLVVKEILHNVVKHSDARNVIIQVILDQTEVSLVLEDDGRGFDIEKEEEKGNGLRNMRKRIEQAKGKIELLSSEKGTRINLTLTMDRLESQPEHLPDET
mgnify:CR=1 FL=1